jgi:hypothetical protein
MTYEQALKEARRARDARCEGPALLALTCEALARVHAVNPPPRHRRGQEAGTRRRAGPQAGPR